MLVRNYLNYIGSKDRYLPQIMPFIEEGSRLVNGALFIDLFCGSAVVGVNSSHLFKDTRCYDNCKQLIELHKWVKNTDKEDMLATLDDIKEVYDLSKINKKGFLALRQAYNESEDKLELSPELYMLITHSFNYSMHFNKSGGFSVPFGTNKSSFNSSLRKKLENWKDTLDNAENYVEFDAIDAFEVGRQLFSNFNRKFVVFVDPPYSASISKHPYRVGSAKWDEEHDRNLLKMLDSVDRHANYFIFTNCISNNGVHNKILQDWIYANKDKYTVTPVGVDYTNCSYQRLNKGKTQEVIITNFTLGVDKNNKV